MTEHAAPCPEYEPLILERLSGGLDAVASERLAAHLDACAPCRGEAAALEETLSLAALPPPSPEEERALSHLPQATLSALRRRHRRAILRRGVGAGLLVAAAAAAALVLSPAVFHRAPRNEQAVAQTWQEPDFDALWVASGAVDLGDTSDGDLGLASDSSVALAALDDAESP